MPRKRYPSDELAQFNLRMPKGLKKKLQELAKRSGRSLNREIVAHLEQAIEAPAGEDSQLEARLRKVERTLEDVLKRLPQARS